MTLVRAVSIVVAIAAMRLVAGLQRPAAQRRLAYEPGAARHDRLTQQTQR